MGWDALYSIEPSCKASHPFHLPIDKSLRKSGNAYFAGRYYLRAGIKSNADLEYVMSIVEKIGGRSNIIVSDDTVFFMTGEVHADVFDELMVKLKERISDVFYARIYS